MHGDDPDVDRGPIVAQVFARCEGNRPDGGREFFPIGSATACPEGRYRCQMPQGAVAPILSAGMRS
ncbi:hypothetical protein, partial [Escherichia coli]|uniref:hypothetical protein n=1 Tax=Escherichia coli TaxID=562 RepID=UPI001BDB83B0